MTDTNKSTPTTDAEKRFVELVNHGNVPLLRFLFEENPNLKSVINECWFAFDSPAVVAGKHQADLVMALVDLGADINARSNWWAGSFGVLDGLKAKTYQTYLELGAIPTLNSAAEQGDLVTVQKMVEENPDCVNAPGGDGQTAMHVAKTIEICNFLLDHGADLTIRDLDHSATAAQYQLNRPEICRHLVTCGAEPDIFMACALNDREMVEVVLNSNPDSINQRVNRCAATGPIHEEASLHIYFWKLKQATTPLEVCHKFGNKALFSELFHRADPQQQFLSAAWTGDAKLADDVWTTTPGLDKSFSADDQVELARAAWEGRLESVKILLKHGFDPHLAGPEESTPLDRAAFHGYTEIIKTLLAHDPNPPLTRKNKYGGTPLSACVYGSVHSWIKEGNDHFESVKTLIAAGAPFDKNWLPTENPLMDELLEEYLNG